MDYPKITKTQVKFIQSLKLKKYRQKYNKYTIESHKIIKEVLNYNENYIDIVIGTEDYLSEHFELFLDFKGEVLASSQKNIDMMSQLKSSASVVALCSETSDLQLGESIEKGKYLFLEDMQNPGNVGTMFRSADWFGYDGILLSEQSVEIFNQKLIHGSMGSVFRVPHRIVNVEQLSNISLPKIATIMEGEDIKSYDFPEDFILCMGNEGQGLSSDLLDICVSKVSIPGAKEKGAESLNVAISSSIFMFQSVK